MTRILLGVMLPPWATITHTRWEAWRGLQTLNGTTDLTVTYVVGDYTASFKHTRVDGRERLPHVGKVTEKSAAWWLMPGDDDWRCKSDDDTLVHIPRLEQTLRLLDASQPVYFGHLKWRGWEIGEYRACGGVWGNAMNVWDHFEHSARCRHASGPFAYMVGAFYCMSRAARTLLAADAEFHAFLREARRRNDHGVPCTKAHRCANAPSASRMWHHEDAGIGMNLFRAIVRANATLRLVATPGHYNDPFAIELSNRSQDIHWSSRALWVHGVKRAKLFERVLGHWQLSRTLVLPPLKCTLPIKDVHSRWEWTRLPCSPNATRLCHLHAHKHFQVCRWPW